MYEDELGEPIVVAAVALGMPAMMLQRILLCLCPAISQSVQRVYELALLHEEIKPDAALRLVAIWRASHPAESKSLTRTATAHQPQYSRDEKSERNTPALPVTRSKVAWDELVQSRKSGKRLTFSSSFRRTAGSRHHRIEKTAPGAVFDLDDPDVGVEFDLACQIGLGVGLGGAVRLQAADECAIGRPRFVEHALRRRSIDIGSAVELRHLDEHRARLLGAAAAQHGLRTFDLAAADVGRDPYAGFQTHDDPTLPGVRLTTTTGSLLQRPAGQRREIAHQLVRDLAGHRPPPRLLETLDGGAGLGVVDARGLHRTVAEIGERALHRDDARRWAPAAPRSDRCAGSATGCALMAERAIEASSMSFGSAEGRRPAACSKSRIAVSVFGP